MCDDTYFRFYYLNRVLSRGLIQINHQPDATILQFIILKFIYSSTCFGRSPAHHQELNDCSTSLWFYLRLVVPFLLCSWSGRSARPRTQHDCHHDTKVKPEAATAVIELLMTGGRMPETCWAVNKRQDNKLENCCIRLVIWNGKRTVLLSDTLPLVWRWLLKKWDDLSPDVDQIQTGCRATSSEIKRLCTSIWDKEVSPRQWKESIIVPVLRRAINRLQKLLRHVTVLSYILNSIQPPAAKVNFTCRRYYWGSPVRIRSTVDNTFRIRKKTSPIMPIKRAEHQLYINLGLRFRNKKGIV